MKDKIDEQTGPCEGRGQASVYRLHRRLAQTYIVIRKKIQKKFQEYVQDVQKIDLVMEVWSEAFNLDIRDALTLDIDCDWQIEDPAVARLLTSTYCRPISSTHT